MTTACLSGHKGAQEGTGPVWPPRGAANLRYYDCGSPVAAPRGGQTGAVNPCARQASHRHFIVSCSTSFSHSTPTEANFLVLCAAPESRILKANFQNIAGVTMTTPDSADSLCERGLPHPEPPQRSAFDRAQDASTPLLVPRPSCPSEIMVPYLCPSKNKLLAPPLPVTLVRMSPETVKW